MSIILDENSYAERRISTHDIGKKPFETLSLVARYYIDKGYKPKIVRRMMDEYLIRCNATVSLPKWAVICDKALSRATKRPAVKIDCIEITKPEIDRIRGINGKQCQRLAFTLLCLSKYWAGVNAKSNGWVNNKDNEIMSMANINTSLKRQSALFGMLNSLGLIRYASRVDNINVQVCFAEGGEVVMRIDDFRNLGYQYNAYFDPDSYIKCRACGVMVSKRCANHKYCASCAIDIQKLQKRESKMKKEA